MSPDELAARLRATFAGELQEQVRAMNEALLALEAAPDGLEHVHALFRVAHTLKGASRAANVPAVERVCHNLESLLAEARDGTKTLGAPDFHLLFAAADALAEAGERLSAGGGVDDARLGAVVRALKGWAGHEAPPPPSAPAPSPPAPPRPAPPRPVASEPAALAGAEGQVRVAASKLDALLASSGDLLVAAGRPALRAAEAEELHEALTRCATRWREDSRRLLLSLHRLGAGAEEPSLLALGDDLQRLTREAGRLAAAARRDARALAKNVDDVVDQARTLRLRPFSEACAALPRAVRDLATSAGKEVEFRVAGGDVEADRVVLDGLREALLQLVRNAVDHGIEAPAARAAAGKPRLGSVVVAAGLRGERLSVTVSDDGAGLDLPAIRGALRRRGLAVPDDDDGAIRAFLEGRVTTRAEATTVSGRGVGLDVARTAVHNLGGHLTVTWQEGGGTVFHLDAPVSLSSTRVLMVGVGSHLVAIPISYVERLVRVAPEGLRLTEGRHVLPTDTGPVPVVSLARLLPPLAERPATGGPLALVLFAAGGRRLAAAVDELLEAREVVVRPIRGGASRTVSLRGAALLESGRIALVLDPPSVVAAGLAPNAGAGLTVEPRRAAPTAPGVGAP
jgi:two-component system chemotaxis sensor kinase CheA